MTASSSSTATGRPPPRPGARSCRSTARGHGRSPGPRVYSPGLDASVADVQSFVDHVSATAGIPVERMAVVAQSVGAVLAATWVHDYAPRLAALVLASPAFRVKLYVPF